jgi:hypothetical protein
MPNRTVRANARTTPKPKPGSAESVRRKTAELKTATALLKEARPVIERVERELGIEPPIKAAKGRPAVELPEIDGDIEDVVILTSLAAALASDIPFLPEMTDKQRLTIRQLDHVIYKACEAAQDLQDKYLGEGVQP